MSVSLQGINICSSFHSWHTSLNFFNIETQQFWPVWPIGSQGFLIAHLTIFLMVNFTPVLIFVFVKLKLGGCWGGLPQKFREIRVGHWSVWKRPRNRSFRWFLFLTLALIAIHNFCIFNFLVYFREQLHFFLNNFIWNGFFFTKSEERHTGEIGKLFIELLIHFFFQKILSIGLQGINFW